MFIDLETADDEAVAEPTTRRYRSLCPECRVYGSHSHGCPEAPGPQRKTKENDDE